ncbi:MAG: hypothetical protein D4R64_10930 [Porphyromonadaceae bacterium]|nr:MAG: hypothetical protein D4R64_10930 [Porphyromonadaceae bacterium]
MPGMPFPFSMVSHPFSPGPVHFISNLNMKFTTFGAIQPGIVDNYFYINPKTIVSAVFAYLFLIRLFFFFKWWFPIHNILII